MTQDQQSSPSSRYLLDHSYDGIQEYDNPLPRWWVAIFWISVLFAPFYILYFHFGVGKLKHERYEAEIAAFQERQTEQLASLGEITESTLITLGENPSAQKTGKEIFQGKCASCHGMFGEGGIGPNLTDTYWLHGPQLLDIYRTVRDGVPEKGMVSWERQLKPAELLSVSSYVGSLLGSGPPQAKAPQGEIMERKAADDMPAGGEPETS